MIIAAVVLLIVFIVRSKYKRASATLYVGSDPGDKSTKPLLLPAEEVGPQPYPTPGIHQLGIHETIL